MKDTCNRSELRFSQWLETLRKDFECTFGILKGRWRILKTGTCVHNTEACDNIWMTCCALHNLLLDVDGLWHKWEDGFPSSYYETDDGQFQDKDIPAAIRRLVDPTGSEGHRLRTFVSSRFGFRNNVNDDNDKDNDNDNEDHDDDNNHIENINHSGILQLPLVQSGRSVKSIEFHRFRAMLIDNFNIAFHGNRLKWPKRFAKNTKPVPILLPN